MSSALDIVGTGTARVEVRALDGPPRQTTAGRRGNRGQTTTSADARVKGDEPVRATEPVALSAPAKSRPDSLSRPDSPPRAAVQPPTPPVTATQPERLFAQAGKFTKRDDAVQLVDRLKAQGFVNAFVVTEDGSRKSSHRVRVGPLLDAAEVERVSDQLRGFGAKRSRSVVMP